MSKARPMSRLLQAAAAGLLGLFVATATHSPPPAHAQSYERDPAYQEFYETLDQHGEWVSHRRYGETWVPYANEDPGWRPYSRGQWVYTEEHGWLWDSEEEFGWVVYHYGRWLLDQRHGWMWVPGTEWGPAWVAWREGDNAIGWAPLPPEADFDSSGELVFDAYASPRQASMWMFVAPAMLTMPAIYRHFYPRNRASFYFGRSRAATYYGFSGRRVFNRGIDRRFIEQRARRPVPVIQIQPVQRPRDIDRRRPGEDRRPIGIYRPNLPPPGARSPGSRPPGGRDGWDRRPPVGSTEPFPRPGVGTGPTPRPVMPPSRGGIDTQPGGWRPGPTQPGSSRPEEGRPRRPSVDGNWRPPVPVTTPPSAGPPPNKGGGPRIEGPIMRPPPMNAPRTGPSDDRPRPSFEGRPRQPPSGFAPPTPPPRPQMQAPPPSPRPQLQTPPPPPRGATPPQPRREAPPQKRPPQGGTLDDNRPRGGPRQ